MGDTIATRTKTHESVILANRDCQEFRIVTLLSAEEGVTEAFLYGGSKSKLKSFASPFHAGTAWIYREPNRETGKLSDFEIRETYPSLRESLVKTWTATLWAEVAIKTLSGGGDFPDAERSFEESLKALDIMDEADAAYPSILWLWRTLGSAGIRPSIDACETCGKAFSDSETVFLSRDHSGFSCGNCHDAYKDEGDTADGGNPHFALESPGLFPGARRYLTTTGRMPLKSALNVRLDKQATSALKEIVYGLAARSCEGKIRTLESCGGIL